MRAIILWKGGKMSEILLKSDKIVVWERQSTITTLKGHMVNDIKEEYSFPMDPVTQWHPNEQDKYMDMKEVLDTLHTAKKNNRPQRYMSALSVLHTDAWYVQREGRKTLI